MALASILRWERSLRLFLSLFEVEIRNYDCAVAIWNSCMKISKITWDCAGNGLEHPVGTILDFSKIQFVESSYPSFSSINVKLKLRDSEKSANEAWGNPDVLFWECTTKTCQEEISNSGCRQMLESTCHASSGILESCNYLSQLHVVSDKNTIITLHTSEQDQSRLGYTLVSWDIP